MKRLVVFCVALLLSAGVRAQDFSLSTNLLGYLNLGTLNMEAACAFSRHWSATAGVKYNPFSFSSPRTGEQMQSRQQALALGARFWPWHIYSGWWVAGKLQAQEFNEGGIKDLMTSEGERYGGGLTAGYTYMLHPHLNLEIGFGAWTGWERFVNYACPVCGAVIDEGEKTFLKPNDIILSLTYVF